MAECTDKRYGDLLHAYELNLLPDEERQRFEVHLLECHSCFERVKDMESVSQLLNQDQDVRRVVKVLAANAGTEPESAERKDDDKAGSGKHAGKGNFKRYLLAAALTICIALPGYYYLSRTGPEQEVTQEMILLPMRGTTSRELSLQMGGQAEIRFVLEHAVQDHPYVVTIASSDLVSDTVYANREFDGFNENGMGTIRLPITQFESGFYKLTISDPTVSAEPIREYRFTVK